VPKKAQERAASANIALIERVAAIARLELTEDEKKKFSLDLEGILKAFTAIDKAEVAKLEPAFHPIELKDVLRDDAVEASWPQEVALQNSPEQNKEKGFFRGPKVV